MVVVAVNISKLCVHSHHDVGIVEHRLVMVEGYQFVILDVAGIVFCGAALD